MFDLKARYATFVISLRFMVKLSPLRVVFSSKGFHVNLVFFFYFVFLYCCIDHNSSPLAPNM